MAISRAKKEELVAQYTELISNSNAIFLTEYTGLDVKAINALRGDVYEANGTFHVTKNTLLLRALEASDYTIPDGFLEGQLATGFALEEAPTLAKTLVGFAKKNDNLTIKGGYMGDVFLTTEEIEALAKLPSLDQLRSQLLGLLNTPAQNIAGVVAGGIRQVVNVIDAYAKKEEDAVEAA
ncbi:MAG TPA: 50S ribosomal protein L10 [Anaerolineae bacterium]|nr:50S ribosomal protein L10 [Anaerolineae bacterium]HIP70153.1 50S ribosomal protein L10 [Anaerolineae bacterium]